MPLAEVFGWMHRHQSPTFWAKIQAAQTISRPRDRLTKKDVVVVTDAQLLNTREGQNLLALARRAGAKVILTGDKSHAPGSGGAGGAFRYLLDRRRSYQIMPERGDRPESVAAHDLRRGRAETAVKGLLAEGRVYSGDSLREAALTLFDQYRAAEGLIEPARHMIVTGKPREANRFNAWVQRERQRAGLLGLASVRVPKGPRVRTGDRVVMTRSHGALGVRTGETGTVASVNPFLRTVTVRKDTGGEVTIPVDRFPHLALGYAAVLGRASAGALHQRLRPPQGLQARPTRARPAGVVVLATGADGRPRAGGGAGGTLHRPRPRIAHRRPPATGSQDVGDLPPSRIRLRPVPDSRPPSHVSDVLPLILV